MERFPQPVTHLNGNITGVTTGYGTYFDTSCAESVTFFIDVTEVANVGSPTSSKLELFPQVSPDWGATWYECDQLGDDITAAIHSAELVPSTTPLASGMRIKYVLSVVTTNVKQVETATCAGTVTTAGDAKVTVTSALYAAPVEVAVALAIDDDANAIATKIRAALTADTDIAEHFTVSGATDKVILTAKVEAANDATLNIAIDDDTSAGVTAAATSADTTAGVFNSANYNGVKIRSVVRNK